MCGEGERPCFAVVAITSNFNTYIHKNFRENERERGESCVFCFISELQCICICDMLYVGIADQKDQLFWPKSGMERNCPVLNNWVTNPYPSPMTSSSSTSKVVNKDPLSRKR